MQERIKRDVDFSEFLKMLKREGRPAYLPFYEHVVSSGFVAKRTETNFDKMKEGEEGYWAMGTGNSLTDYMPVENYITILKESIEVSESVMV